jgi:hypothetical protein
MAEFVRFALDDGSEVLFEFPARELGGQPGRATASRLG